MKARLSIILVVLMLVLLTASIASAQPSYPNPALSSYQVVNLSANPQTINVTYYDGTGAVKGTANYPNVPANGVVTVLMATDTNVNGSGEFSAVLGATDRIAAIVNQQLGTRGDTTSIPPFSSYGAAGGGSDKVIVPVAMSNWFGYNTDVFIQNVGNTDATVQMVYNPTTLNGCTTGTAGQSEASFTLKPYATRKVTQFGKANLGAPAAGGACASFNGRFLGSATVTTTSGKPVAVVVNQYIQDKLFTYNAFPGTAAGTKILAPAYLRNWFNYYASLTIANPADPGGTDSQVKVTYTPSNQPGVNPLTPIVANHTVPAGKSITIYDGPTGTSDLSAAYPFGTNKRFFGSVTIESTNNVPVVAMVNQEATLAGGNQAGTYNGAAGGEGTKKISVPLIQSDFYGYYTSLTISTVDGANSTLKICYTSDGTFSSVKNFTKCYDHTTTNGFLNRYEGKTATAAQSDILDDPAWASGGQRRFIGSASIEVTSGPNVVSFVNSESNSAPSAATRDSMYSFNAFNLP